jgi:ribosomal protein L31
MNISYYAPSRFGGINMAKPDIHPAWTVCINTCNCGNKIEFVSTTGKSEQLSEYCPECHPTWTGKTATTTETGRVAKFKKKYNQT